MIIFFPRERRVIFQIFRIKTLDFKYLLCIIASKLISSTQFYKSFLMEVPGHLFWWGVCHNHRQVSIKLMFPCTILQNWLEPALSTGTKVLKQFRYSAVQAEACNGIR